MLPGLPRFFPPLRWSPPPAKRSTYVLYFFSFLEKGSNRLTDCPSRTSRFNNGIGLLAGIGLPPFFSRSHRSLFSPPLFFLSSLRSGQSREHGVPLTHSSPLFPPPRPQFQPFYLQNNFSQPDSLVLLPKGAFLDFSIRTFRDRRFSILLGCSRD